jgi:hypothetical protein
MRVNALMSRIVTGIITETDLLRAFVAADVPAAASAESRRQ